MKTYLAITPKEAEQLPPCSAPLVHIAYVIDADGMLARSNLPDRIRGGLMGLSDRCKKPLPRTQALVRTILHECDVRQFDGVFADFDLSPLPDRVPFLDQLGAALSQRGKQLYAPLFVPSGCVPVSTAISGGSLREMLCDARSRYGAERTALDVQRLIMDFPLPCMSGQGRPMTVEELHAFQKRRDISVFYSRELGAHYFTHRLDGETHFVLFDDAQSLRAKLSLGTQLGFSAAFLMYPEVRDLLPEVLR